jgi:hypothetical protein
LGKRDVDAPSVPQPVAEAYQCAIQVLLARTAQLTETHELALSGDAYTELRTFSVWLEPQLAPDGDLGAMTDWAGKLAGAVARVAGILHMATHAHRGDAWKSPIQRGTMQSAICIGRYLIPHARIAFTTMSMDGTVAKAYHVLAWIERTGATSFTVRDAFHKLESSRFEKVADLLPALDLLEQRGYIRKCDSISRKGPQGQGRPRSQKYEVNPLVHHDKGCDHAKGDASGDFLDSVDSVDFVGDVQDLAGGSAMERHRAGGADDGWETIRI